MGLTLTIMNQMRERLATLTSAGQAVKAFVGDPPSNPGLPFIFVWGPPTLAASEAMSGCGGDIDVRLHVQVVAATTVNVLALADDVTARLRGWTPTVEGWRTCALITARSARLRTARPDTARSPCAHAPHPRRSPEWSPPTTPEPASFRTSPSTG